MYVFEHKGPEYILTEKLDTLLSPFESFGFSVDCTDSVIAVGSPDYVSYTTVNGQVVFDDVATGTVRLFRKDPTVESLEVIAKQAPTIVLDKIRSISLYDKLKNVKIQDIDYVDHAKLKILNFGKINMYLVFFVLNFVLFMFISNLSFLALSVNLIIVDVFLTK